MAKTVAERLAEGRKNRQAGQSSIQHSSTSSVSERLAKSRLGKTINFDTFESDLKSLGTTVESIYNGWQDQDTMNNTKANIVTMQERLNAYQEYAKLFGGEDVTELANGYKAILEDWDNRAATYSKFKTAQDYTKAAEREKSLPTADLNAVSMEVADLDKQIAEIKAQKAKFDDEYKASGGYVPSTSHYNRPSANQVKPYQDWQAKSSEYEKQIKDLENKKADRQAYYEDAKTTQETLATIQKETAMASDPKNMDGYNQYVADYNKAQAEKDNRPWWQQAVIMASTTSENPFSNTINTVIQQKREDKSWQLPQGDWSDDEKRVLGGYFLTDPDKAIDYVVKKNNEKAKGEQAKTETKIQGSATSNVGMGALHTAGSILTAPFGLVDVLDDVTDKVAGRPIIEESFVTPFEYSQAVTSGISTHLNDVSGTLNENIPVIGGKGLGDVYGLGQSVLQSAASAYTLGPVGTLVSYFGQGAAAGVDDALSRGATDEQALTYGLVLGAAEGVSEMMGADKLLKLGSPNEIRKILVNAFKKGGGKQFWSLVDKQGKAEAIEELFSGVAGQVADNFILQGKSNFEALTREYRAMGMSEVEAQKKAWMKSIGDVAYDTLGGYISGAFHAGPQIAVSAHKLNAENKTIGKEIRGNERATDMLNIASLFPKESDAYAAYTEYAKQGVNAENITDAQLGNLYGMADADARDVLASKKSSLEQRRQATETTKQLSAVHEKGTLDKETIERIDRRTTYEEGLHESADLLIQEGLESAKNTDSFKLATKFKERVDNGEKLSTQDIVKLQTANEKAIKQEEVAARVKNMPKAEADLFLKMYDGKSDVDEFGDSFNLVLGLAKDKFPADYILERRGVLSAKQVESIQKEVILNPLVAKQKRLNEIVKQQGDNLEIQGTIDDSAIDYDNTGADGKVNWNDIHPNTKATISLISAFSVKSAGMDVKLVTNGREHGFVGQYDIRENTVYIDINAVDTKMQSADTKGRHDNSRVIINAAAHEFTHWMEDKAPELYAEYSKMVLDTLTSGSKTLDDLITERKKRLDAAEERRVAKAKKEGKEYTKHEYTPNEVMKEIVARASEDMLSLSEEGKKIFESLSESDKKQFANKIQEIFHNIMDWINNVLSTLKSSAPEAKLLRELAEDIATISKKWDEMLRQAAKANAAMKKAGVNDKAIMESKANVDAQNADVEDSQDGLPGKITADMSDAERYEILKNRRLSVAAFNPKEYERVISENPLLLDKKLKETDAKKLLKKIGSEFGVFNKYSNSDFEIEFEFGRNNMDESLHKQRGNYDLYAQMLSCFPDVIANAVGIEIHNRNDMGYKPDRTLKNVYVLSSVFENNTDFIPVKLEIKEFSDKPNHLYVAVALEGIKKDRVESVGVPNNRSHVRTSPVTISIHDLFSNVNPSDVDFLKYIPNGFLNAEQRATLSAKLDADYMKAVEGGNTEKVHGMVANAAKRAGYTIEAYHGSRNEFTVFSSDKRGSSTNTETSKRWFFAADQTTANSYYPYGVIEALQGKDAAEKLKNKGKLYHLFLRMSNPLEADVKDYDYAAHRENRDAMMEYSEQADKNGNDGIILYHALDNQLNTSARESTVYMFRDSAQAKSADPITYDDNGNVIPLSKRFDASNEDIRYSDIDELDDLNAQLKEKHNQVYSASMELKKFDAKAAEDKLYAVLQKDGASKQELDAALQEYAKWGEESGYADASAKLSALKDEEKLLRREIQKVEDRLHDELKEQIAHWDEEDVKKYVAKAVRKYHTTTNLEKASYLVTTGSMLDFSDGQGYRVKDHREISEILDLPDYAEYSDGMIAFMNMGNIRLQTYGIDVSAMPNAKQFSALRDIIFKVMRENDEFSVDFSKTDGYSAGSVTYGKGTSASKIIADIKSYFETGVVPEEQSSIRDFLYSDIDVEVDIYEVLGENERLNKENKTIREDVDRLKERLKLERQLTHGNHFNENQLDAVAGHIRNLGNSNYSKPELINKLREVYTHIATSKEVTWDDLFARLYGIAEDVLGAARPVHSPNDYYANIYRDLRNTEIALSEEQKQYVKDMLGVDSHKAFFGKIKVSNNGIPLNSKWEEWAAKYPNEFAETNDKDQVLALLDIYETAKELKEAVEEYNEVERTRWLANEIYNQYWNVSPIRTTADKYDQQIKRLNYEHRNAMKELRDSYNERLEKQKKADRAERSRIFKKLREDHIKELKEIRQSGKERLDKYKEEAARKTRIQSVTANSLTLNEWLVKNSKDKHIHESMKGPVIALLNAIDFSSKRALGMWGGDMSGVPTNKDISLQKALSQVQQMMADASVGKEELVLLYGHELDADIKVMVESVDDIMRNVGDNEFVLNKMTLNDLITLDNVVKTIKHAVTNMNKFHTVHHAKGIANLAQEEINYADKLGKAKIYTDKSFKAGVKKLLAWKNINPYYAFKRFGAAGKKIFEAFQDGYDKFAFNIKEIIDFTNSTYKAKEVQDWEKEIKTFKLRMPATEEQLARADYEPEYQDVQMTVAQIMDLYLLNKREAARVHLLGGGIRIADIETKGSEVISQAEGALLEQSEIDAIIKTLTPRQIEVADALSKFMNTTTTDWGNEVSMARFGYKAFGEKNYVPMQVDKNNLAVDDETEKNNSLFRLLNMSFTKGLTEGANNRLVISSIFDVFAQHTSDMAKYNALALPVLDAFRWYNYKEKGFKGETAFVTKSVKQAIENAFGKDGQSYITTFLKDLNGQENTSRDTVGKSFFTKAKIASVGANIRVALLQPTAYLKASANIDNKYLIKALFHKPKIGRAEQYCGMALWKSLGYFDTNVQRGVADQIKHAETKYDKAVELSMKGAEWGDKLTFGYLWNAAELEIREKRKNLKVGSDEFYFEVGKRLRDIIYSTQVVDSVMTRSEMMRSPDWGDKLLTTFASEPTLAYNMLADAYFQTQLDARELGSKKAAIKKNAKHMARVFTAYTVTNLVAALVESGFDVLRDDDDEEMDAAEFMKLYFENFATNQSITAKIPWLKEAVSILQGFTSTRMDTQWIQTFSNTLKQVAKLMQGEGSPTKLIKNGLQTISYAFGLPFYNAYRDFMATLNKLDILTAEELEEILEDFIE